MRNKWVVIIIKILLESLNKIIGLNKFLELLNVVKFIISEDIVVVREVLERFSMGKIEIIVGVVGGIKYIFLIGYDKKKEFLLELCNLLEDGGRVILGNIIYMIDLMYNLEIISKVGVMFLFCF